MKETMMDDDALIQAARSAGLIDESLLKIAKPHVSPTAAVADLQRRFPKAFPPVVRDMTDKQADAWFADLTAPKPRVLPAHLAKSVSEMTLAELEAFERFHGIQPDASEQARRRRVHAAQDIRSFG